MNKEEEIKDEKLASFSEEIFMFHEFMTHVGEEMTNKKNGIEYDGNNKENGRLLREVR